MKNSIKQIAAQRVQILFQQAKTIHKENPELSRQYVMNARKIAMAAKMRMPATFRRQTCRKCNSLLIPGENSRVRIKQKREPHVVITCLDCGNITRIMLRDKKGEKNEQNNNSNETSCQI